MKNGRVLVGHFGVDAGLCWIGDPCYILHTDDGKIPSSLGKDWGDFCNKLGDDYPTMKSFGYEKGHSGLGICVSTGYGDGSYPVYATLEDGRVKKIEIEFFDDESEEESEAMIEESENEEVEED